MVSGHLTESSGHDPPRNASLFKLDTSLSIHDWVKMAITINIDLDLLDQLYSTFIVVFVFTYALFWSIKYGKDYFALLHTYFKKVRDDIG